MERRPNPPSVQKKIQQRQLTEASRLFQEFAPGFQKKERDSLAEQLSTLVRQAKKYFREGEIHEQERELEQAREKYEKVKSISKDYPGLSESLSRVEDAIELIRGVGEGIRVIVRLFGLFVSRLHSARHPVVGRVGWAAEVVCGVGCNAAIFSSCDRGRIL